MKLVVALVVLFGTLPIAHADDELPDPTDRILHWPLLGSEHPELSPHYDVAKDLAEPGLDWLELCKMGAHHRTVPSLKDQTAYLGAWCAIADRDTDKGLVALQSLATSSVRGLPAAIRVDLANVLVNEGTVDRARRLLARHRIKDPVVYDRLTALLIDLNKRDDAREINELSIDFPDGAQNRCMRQARRIVLDPDRYTGLTLDKQPRLFENDCGTLELEVACWLDIGRCGPYFRATKRTSIIHLIAAYNRYVSAPVRYNSVLIAEIKALKKDRDIQFALYLIEKLGQQTCAQARATEARSFMWQITALDAASEATKERASEARDEHRKRCGL